MTQYVRYADLETRESFVRAKKGLVVYQTAEETINSGLSLGARIMLGFVSGLFGAVMFLIAPPTEKAAYFQLFGGFCMLITVACITKGRARQFVGSLIGSALFILSLSYLGYELLVGEFFSPSRAEPSVKNAVLFLLAFGIPGITYAARARFGRGKAP